MTIIIRINKGKLQGIVRRMVLVVNFLCIFEIKYFCFVVAIYMT